MFKYFNKDSRIMYDKYDASFCGLFGILCPIAISMLLAIFVVFISVFTGASAEDITHSVVFTFISSLIVELSFALLFYYYNKSKNINFMTASGINNKINPLCYITVLLLGVGLPFLFSNLIGLWQVGLTSIHYNVSEDLNVPLNNIGQLIVAIIIVGFLPAICEELVFRGVVLNGLRKYGKWPAILISAMLFAFMHANMVQLAYTFILGIIFGLIVYESKSLILSMITHFANNTTVIISTYLAQNDTAEIVVNGEYVLYAILFAIVGVVVVALCAMLIKNLCKKDNIDRNGKQTDIEQVVLINGEQTPLVNVTNEKFKTYLRLSVIISISMLVLDCLTNINF